MDAAPVRIGLLGCGTVGAALVGLIEAESEVIAQRTGIGLTVAKVAVRDLAKPRPVQLAPGVLTDDPSEVVGGDDVDIVVEVMGGIEPARTWLLDALGFGRPVVTANKELLAAHADELFDAAEAAGVDLLFEAAVAGGIPIMRPLRESLLGEPVRRVMGIVNGTTNYILDQMTTEGVGYGAALAEAQRLGYAEADPTADVDGHDAAAKAAILASIAFGVRVRSADVWREGIGAITESDIDFASRNGRVVKLLAVAESDHKADRNRVAVRVHPALVPEDHPLASVHESFNAVFVEGDAVGELMFYGRGAGGRPTASAVLGDVIDAAVNLRRRASASVGTLRDVDVVPIDELVGEYCITLDVVDEPGVLATVAGVFGAHSVSIRSMVQEGLGDEARLVFITHDAREAAVRDTLAELRSLPVLRREGTVIRLVG